MKVIGAPRTHDGRFRNNHRNDPHGGGSLLKFLREMRTRRWTRPHFARAQNDPTWLAANRSVTSCTWIGHASFLVQLGGLNILTDPVFSRRTSPVQWAGPERLAPLGLHFDELPKIDVVLISHNHYDHLDEATVHRLAGRDAPAFVVPLGLKDWFTRRRIPQVTELDWWQSTDARGLIVHAVPAQHFSGRSATDRNRSLWCGFVFERAGQCRHGACEAVGSQDGSASMALPSKPNRGAGGTALDRSSNASTDQSTAGAGQRHFFAGDTGYGPDFADIGARFAPIDVAMIPIGAYDPRSFMRPVHVDPAEAVRIHRDVGSRLSLAMHWGTFRLTLEPLEEPPKRLAEALAEQGVDPQTFRVMQHGEMLTPPW